MDAIHTYFSSTHFAHIDIRSSQKSIGRSFADLLNPSTGILPNIIDWKDSLGADGKAYLLNSSTVRGWSDLYRWSNMAPINYLYQLKTHNDCRENLTSNRSSLAMIASSSTAGFCSGSVVGGSSAATTSKAPAGLSAVFRFLFPGLDGEPVVFF